MDKELKLKLDYREDFEWENRFLKQENVEVDGKKYFVSTVDLGIDHSWGFGEPLYYETMIFPLDKEGKREYYGLYTERYSTKDKALKNHEVIVMKMKNGNFDIDEDGFIEF